MLQKTSSLFQPGQDKFKNDTGNFYHRNTSNNRNFKCNQRKERALTKYKKEKR